jgi:hypothetical protein
MTEPDDDPNAIRFSVRTHRTDEHAIALVIEQGEDMIAIPVETPEMACNMADDIAKAINIYSCNFDKIVKAAEEE